MRTAVPVAAVLLVAALVALFVVSGGEGEQDADGRDGLHGPGSARLGSQSFGPRLPPAV